jgi:hypothetical protein
LIIAKTCKQVIHGLLEIHLYDNLFNTKLGMVATK